MQTALNKKKERLEKLFKFQAKYNLPDDFYPVVDTQVYVYCFIDCDEKLLCTSGELLGTDGWVSIPDGSFYSWQKEIDGVMVKLVNVSRRPTEQHRPVDPKEFPLQLTN